jgi:hypothetical protein
MGKDIYSQLVDGGYPGPFDPFMPRGKIYAG